MSAAANKPNLVRATIHGTIWMYISVYSAKFMVFISTTILARLLSKEDFGVAGYALLAMSFIDFLQGLGIRQALVYHEERDGRTNTAFWLGIGVGLILFLLGIVVLAPVAGWWFDDPRAVSVTRVLALSLPISSLAIVHNALLRKKLAFNRQFLPEFSRAITKGGFSILLAYLGWGAWSLIFGQIVGVFASVMMFWVVIPWRPKFRFESQYVRSLLSYGSQIVYNSALSTVLANLDYLLIGHYLGVTALGVYTLAFRIPELLIKQFSEIIGRVTFPVYSKIKEDGEALKRGFLLTLQYVNLITIPLGLGLALIARPFILVFFGEKWLEAVPIMAAISIFSLLRAMVFNVGDVYKALGRPDLLVKVNFFQAIISLPALWWAAAELGTLNAVAWMQVGLVAVAGLIKLVISTQVLHLDFRLILKALRAPLLAGAMMFAAVFISLQITEEALPLLQLILGVLVGGLTYLGSLWWFDRSLFEQALSGLKMAVKRKRNLPG